MDGVVVGVREEGVALWVDIGVNWVGVYIFSVQLALVVENIAVEWFYVDQIDQNIALLGKFITFVDDLLLVDEHIAFSVGG